MLRNENLVCSLLRLLFYTESTVVSLPVLTCVLQKQRANALHMEEYAMTNNDDGSYHCLDLAKLQTQQGRLCFLILAVSCIESAADRQVTFRYISPLDHK